MTLAGRHIVITRPAEQATPLADSISALGGIPVRFPVLAIQALVDLQPLHDLAARLDDFDLAVFVSPNAVNHALGVITAQRPWPSRLRVAALGLSSERALARFGIRDVIAPRERFDSEALLELPDLQRMQGQRVVILRGDGGRELLGDTLQARGATLEYVTCYHRAVPQLDLEPLRALWAKASMDAFVITSSEGLRNLWQMLDPACRERLRLTAVFAPHARIVAEAHSLGLACVVATGPGDAGVLAGMTAYFAQQCAEKTMADQSAGPVSGANSGQGESGE